LDDAAIATSGNYRNYFERDGTRYSHIIDPRSGAPVRHALASVAVVARSAMQADALATALLVLGPEEGLRLAAEKNIAAHFIVRRGDGFRELRTNAFERVEAK
jgi:thiamine biosynthesis lipoprotein